MVFSKLIRQFMVSSIERSIIVSSWGISDIQISENKIEFNVCGFNFNGHIELHELNDILIVTTSDAISLSFKSVNDVIDYLDLKIEYDENYLSNIGSIIERMP